MALQLLDRQSFVPDDPDAFDASTDLITGIGGAGTVYKRLYGPRTDEIAAPGWSGMIVGNNQYGRTDVADLATFSTVGKGLVYTAWVHPRELAGPGNGFFLELTNALGSGTQGDQRFGFNSSSGSWYRNIYNTSPGDKVFSDEDDIETDRWIQLAGLWHRPSSLGVRVSRFFYRYLGDPAFTLLEEHSGGVSTSASPSRLYWGSRSFSSSFWRGRIGNVTCYYIPDNTTYDTIVDGWIPPVDEIEPVEESHQWKVDFDNGDDDWEGTPARPWKTISKVTGESFNGGLIGRVVDDTDVRSASAAFIAASKAGNKPTRLTALGAALESSLSDFYAHFDCVHLGNSVFGTDALRLFTNGLVLDMDDGEPVLVSTIDPESWTLDSTYTNLYKTTDGGAALSYSILWEDGDWLREQTGASDSAALTALNSGDARSFYSDGITLWLKPRAGESPATNGRTYTRSINRIVSAANEYSAITVFSANVQIKNGTLSGTATALKTSGLSNGGIPIQFGVGAKGICEVRDVNLDKWGKHGISATLSDPDVLVVRNRVDYGPGTPYGTQGTADVDYADDGTGSQAIYMGCTSVNGNLAVVGQSVGTHSGSIYTSHNGGGSHDVLLLFNCNLPARFFDQGQFVGDGIIAIDSTIGGISAACDLLVDRCLTEVEPFGTWTGTTVALTIRNSLLHPKNNSSGFGLSDISGSAVIEGNTIILSDNPSSTLGPDKSLWNFANSASKSIDFRGNLVISSKDFGIFGQAANVTIDSDHNVYCLTGTNKWVATRYGSDGQKTLTQWQALGYDANSQLITDLNDLDINDDFRPLLGSILKSAFPHADSGLLDSTTDYYGLSRPAGAYSIGASEGLVQAVVRVKESALTYPRAYNQALRTR